MRFVVFLYENVRDSGATKVHYERILTFSFSVRQLPMENADASLSFSLMDKLTGQLRGRRGGQLR